MKSSFMLAESKREKKESYGFSLCVSNKIKLFDFVLLLDSTLKWAVRNSHEL